MFVLFSFVLYKPTGHFQRILYWLFGKMKICYSTDTAEWLHFHFSLSCIGEGNGNPLQCSCMENSRDGGAWWAAVYGVTQSRTWLRWLHLHFSHTCIGGGTGNPLQCSCLQNPRDRGACWAAVYGVSQSRIRLKRLSSSNSNKWITTTANELQIRKKNV